MLEHWDSTWFNQQRQVFNSWTKRIATLLGEWVWVSGDEIFVSCWMGWWDCKNPQTQGWLGDHLKKTCFGTLYRMMFVFRKVNHNIYLENCTVNFFCPLLGFTRNGRFFVQLRILVIVKGCSNPLTTPGSDILRQSPKEEFQPDVEQIRSRDRVPKSGHKYCHISHQIWIYP